jgi:signal transduction histidine kinase
MPTPALDVYARGEAIEYRQNNLEAAGEWFQDLARHADDAVKPGALLRFARTLRKQRSFDQALATYLAMLQLPASVIEGAPSDLLARWLRCDLLASLDRVDELRGEAGALLEDLRRGRWRLTRAVYEMHVVDAARWAGRPQPSTRGDAESLAAAIDEFWREHVGDARADSGAAGRNGLPGHDVATERDGAAIRDAAAVAGGRRPVATAEGVGVIVWRQPEPSRLVAFVALPSYVERQWLGPQRLWLDRQHVGVALRDSSARTIPGTTRRPAADSGLPWTIAVTNTDVAAELARLGGRRRLWLTGLAALVVLVVAGTAVAARAVSGELAVARLQADFVAAVSHEFRTPLTSLRQVSEVLQEGRVGTDERRQAYYGALVRQTDRLQRLVDALLDFGRMEAGAAPYRLEPLPIDRLVRDVVAEFTDEAAARGEDVTLHLTSTALVAPADRDAISNAVWNLLDNAIKYSPGAPEAWVDVRLEDDSIAVSVRDRGMGIPLREQRHIFRKFQRGARATSERIRGTGIGLAVVHHVVTAHGGRIDVQSEPDAGSTFTMWLPSASRPGPSDQASAAHGAELSGSGKAEFEFTTRPAAD